MSITIHYEYGFTCPHEMCRFKPNRFNSIESLNMHWSKTHNKTQKISLIKNSKGRLRLILRMK